MFLSVGWIAYKGGNEDTNDYNIACECRVTRLLVSESDSREENIFIFSRGGLFYFNCLPLLSFWITRDFICVIKRLFERWRRRKDRMMLRDRKDSATWGRKRANGGAYQVESQTARSLDQRGSEQGLWRRWSRHWGRKIWQRRRSERCRRWIRQERRWTRLQKTSCVFDEGVGLGEDVVVFGGTGLASAISWVEWYLWETLEFGNLELRHGTGMHREFIQQWPLYDVTGRREKMVSGSALATLDRPQVSNTVNLCYKLSKRNI